MSRGQYNFPDAMRSNDVDRFPAPRLHRLPCRTDYVLIPAPLGMSSSKPPPVELIKNPPKYRPIFTSGNREVASPCYHCHAVVSFLNARFLDRIPR